MACGLYQQYPVEADGTGWPTFWDGDRAELCRQVREVFDIYRRDHGVCALSLRTIYDYGRGHFGWDFGPLWDGIYAVLERAVRECNGEPCWRIAGEPWGVKEQGNG